MRCHLKRNVVWGVVLFLIVLYSFSYTDLLTADLTGIDKSVANGSLWTSLYPQRLTSHESWVVQGGYLPLNVSYQLLAGIPSTKQRFLAVGLASVKRQRGSYLLPTLHSIFSQSSPAERSVMVVVLLLVDFDANWRAATVEEIKAAFASELEQGQLLVLHVHQEYYPPLTGLKRNYNDAPERVTFRSKQNVDYSFLIHYSTGLSHYYLQLEDDVSCAQNFVSSIKRHIDEQEAKSTTWATLEFSALGYIGKLYKSADLPLLARFLFLFYQEMPCDWLLSRFRDLMTQREPILFKPSLFQHMGIFSSFKGTYNKLKDKDFEETAYSNPSADVYTDMSVYKKHVPTLAWASGEGFFWGRSPERGNYLTVVFEKPTVLTGISVETGSGGKDLLNSAVVEIGHDINTTKNNEKSCTDFQTLGTFENGRFEMQEVEKKYGSPSSCLRIRVTADQNEWVMIKKIRVTTKSTPQS